MNFEGIILYRTDEKIEMKKPEGIQHYGPSAWIRIFYDKKTKNRYYFRENHLDFLTALLKHPRVRLGFYS